MVATQRKGGQSMQAMPGDTSFSQNEKLYKKEPLHPPRPFEMPSLQWAAKYTGNKVFIGPAAAVASWKSKVLRLTIGRKSTHSPYKEHNQ